ncbi:MAG TPA: hypothetical protein VHL11_08340, partial [Phototrophicaceae bacterium]|nr:hypothetical protein [Phototrophicaceae bacterium]
MTSSSPQPNNPRLPWFIVCLLILITAALIAISSDTGEASPGGPDDGLLHLAGATSLMRDGIKNYPIVQRPPLY